MISESLNQYAEICRDAIKGSSAFFFDKCQSKPNRKLISRTIKELFGRQRKAA